MEQTAATSANKGSIFVFSEYVNGVIVDLCQTTFEKLSIDNRECKRVGMEEALIFWLGIPTVAVAKVVA